MTRLRVFGTNPTKFTVSCPDRTFAFFRNVTGFVRTRHQGWRRPVKLALLSLPQAGSP